MTLEEKQIELEANVLNFSKRYMQTPRGTAGKGKANGDDLLDDVNCLVDNLSGHIGDQASKIQELEEEIRELRGALNHGYILMSANDKVMNDLFGSTYREYKNIIKQALKDNT